MITFKGWQCNILNTDLFWVSCLHYRQKRKERKQLRRLQRQNHQEEREDSQSAKKHPRREVKPSSLRLVLDCSFDDLMLIKVNNAESHCKNKSPYIYRQEHWENVCFFFRMSGSFTNRSSGAMLRTDEPYTQCRSVACLTVQLKHSIQTSLLVPKGKIQFKQFPAVKKEVTN